MKVNTTENMICNSYDNKNDIKYDSVTISIDSPSLHHNSKRMVKYHRNWHLHMHVH